MRRWPVARSARLVVRVVFVAAAGAAEARRRVADVLLRAATTPAAAADTPAPTITAPEPSPPLHEKAA